ncbi:hypothetical protein ACOME3_007837 [Neoechinorhynchus agilis]
MPSEHVLGKALFKKNVGLNEETQDLIYIYPLIQFPDVNIRTDQEVTEGLLNNEFVDEKTHLFLTTAYFNIYGNYEAKLLANRSSRKTILNASVDSGGWADAKAFILIVFYLLILKEDAIKALSKLYHTCMHISNQSLCELVRPPKSISNSSISGRKAMDSLITQKEFGII